MEEMSEEAKHIAMENDKDWRRSQGMYVAGDEQNDPNRGGFSWFHKLSFFVVAACVIGIAIESAKTPDLDEESKEKQEEIVRQEESSTKKETAVIQDTSDSAPPAEILPFAPKASRQSDDALAKSRSNRSVVTKTKSKQPPKFDSTGQLAKFDRSMTIDCLQTNDAGTRLYAAVNETVIEYDLKTGERLREFTGHDGAIASLDVFDQSRKLITGSTDKTAIVWDLDTGNQLQRLTESNTVGAVAGSRDGELVATAALSKNPQVWSVEKGEPLKRTKIESWPWNSQIKALTFDENAKYLIGGGSSYNSHIWTVSNGRQKGIIYAHKNQYVLDLALSPDGDSLVMLDAAGVKIFDTRRFQERLSIDLSAPKGTQVLVSEDNRHFVAVAGVYDMQDGHSIEQTEIPLSTCRVVTATPDGKRFIYATSRAIEVVAGE